ncbi:hypothetical protein BaRGS_00031788, partial [Batillaria attramentaria]
LGDGVTYPTRTVDNDNDGLLGARQRWMEEGGDGFGTASSSQIGRDSVWIFAVTSAAVLTVLPAMTEGLYLICRTTGKDVLSSQRTSDQLRHAICKYVDVAQRSPRRIDNRGKSFLLFFIENFGDNTEFRLVITSQHDAKIHVDNPMAQVETDKQQEFAVQSGGSVHVTLGGDVAVTSDQVPQKKTVLVVASQPVAVFGFSLEYRSSGGYLALPVEGLGTHYVIATYDGHSHLGVAAGARVAVAAVQDGTEVMVSIRVRTTTICGTRTLLRQDSASFTFQLKAREVMLIVCDNDVTGSIVHSNKPVAVVSGNACTQVPANQRYCDHLVEMLIPVPALGTRYLLHTFQGRDNGAIYRIVPCLPSTVISFGRALPENTGDLPFQQYKLQQGESIAVTAGQGINVSSFPGDPLMTQMPLPDLAPRDYLLDLALPLGDRLLTCYLTAVVRKEFAEGIMVGDKPLTTQLVEDEIYVSMGSEVVNQWPVRVYHPNTDAGFGLLAYCFSQGEGFGFPAGLVLYDSSGVDECASAPCKNDGICYEVGASFRCHCVGVYGGPTCKLEIMETTTEQETTTVQETTEDKTTSPPETTEDKTTSPPETTEDKTTSPPETTEDKTTSPPETTTIPDTTTPPPDTTQQQLETTEVSYEVVPPPPKHLCPCSCGNMPIQPQEGKNTTVEEQVKKEVEKIKEELAVDVKNTSKALHRKTSTYDSRPSATGLGLLGISLTVFVLGFIVIMDTSSLVAYVVHKLRAHQKKSLAVSNGKAKEELVTPSLEHESVAAVPSLGSDMSNDSDLAKQEVSKFVEAVSIDCNPCDQLIQHRGSRRKHLLHVRPETILLHVRGNKQRAGMNAGP